MSSDFERPELVEFFSTQRHTVESLYPSERRFLGWLATSSSSVLDVGCAAGGFADIWHAFNTDVEYTGVDTSRALVEQARVLHPESEFIVSDAAERVELPGAAAETVQALGWLHWEPRYAVALRELWRLTGRALFFDVRLSLDEDCDVIGAQDLVGGGTVPYVVLAWPAFAGLMLTLRPARLLGFGYRGPPADTVRGVPSSLVFATFVLERGAAERPVVCIDAPLPWPDGDGEVALYPGAELARFAPEQRNPGGGH
jgi:SAM-dependent methyltransferase